MKNSNSNDKSFFLDDKGFYIILFLCLVAIGVSGYVLFFTEVPTNDTQIPPIYTPNLESQDDTETTTDDFSKIISDVHEEETDLIDAKSEDTAEVVVPKPLEVEDVSEVSQGKVPAVTAKPENPPEPQKEETLFVSPVPGEVIKVFSGTELVFNETMDDWRVHVGTDFEASEGDRVYAIADGIIDDVYLSELWGQCVVIDHGEELFTVYTGLAENVTVSKGENIKSGEVIGAKGQPTVSEALQKSHIHIEAIQNGQYIDVMNLIQK